MPRKKLTEEEEIARVKDVSMNIIAVITDIRLLRELTRQAEVAAGPVYARRRLYLNDIIIKGINDSKKPSEKKREELFEEITEKAIAYNIFSVDEKRIDEINILNATYEAMNGAVNGLSTAPDFVLIDGNRISGMEIPHETVVKGDIRVFQ